MDISMYNRFRPEGNCKFRLFCFDKEFLKCFQISIRFGLLATTTDEQFQTTKVTQNVKQFHT